MKFDAEFENHIENEHKPKVRMIFAYQAHESVVMPKQETKQEVSLVEVTKLFQKNKKKRRTQKNYDEFFMTSKIAGASALRADEK